LAQALVPAIGVAGRYRGAIGPVIVAQENFSVADSQVRKKLRRFAIIVDAHRIDLAVVVDARPAKK
jgi:hypothetical protein